jgi:hypothetical protein
LVLLVLYGAAFDALSHGILRDAESGRGLRYRKTLYSQVLYPSTDVRHPIASTNGPPSGSRRHLVLSSPHASSIVVWNLRSAPERARRALLPIGQAPALLQ